MATDNYLKVHRPGRAAVEFFFDSHHPVSVASARRAAGELAAALTGVEQGEADVSAANNKTNPRTVDDTPVRVWTHGVRGLGDLHCVGGCDLCAHPMRLRGPEEVDEEAEPGQS